MGFALKSFRITVSDPMWFDLPVQQPRIADGYMFCPQQPGLGIDLNDEVIDKWRVPLSEGAVGHRLQVNL